MTCTKLIILFFLLGLSYVCGNEADFYRLDTIEPEQECLSAGGICTVACDCPKGNLAKQRGLCPKQQAQGIECCYGQSVKETRCKKRGGECLLKPIHCPDKLMFNKATDCPGYTQCCILV